MMQLFLLTAQLGKISNVALRNRKLVPFENVGDRGGCMGGYIVRFNYIYTVFCMHIRTYVRKYTHTERERERERERESKQRMKIAREREE